MSLRAKLRERLEGRFTMNQRLLNQLHSYGSKYQNVASLDDAIAVAKAQARADAYQNALRDVEELFTDFAEEHAELRLAYVKAGPVV